MSTTQKKRGFTILELLVVISIMAIIATLATGAAIKSVRQSRVRRIEAMARALEMALVNFRALENRWPFQLSDLTQDPGDRNLYWAHGENNARIFRHLYPGGSGGSRTVYLDAASFMTRVGGRRMSLRDALSQGRREEAALGYPHPANPNRFCFYCIRYSPLTDTVKVFTQHDGSHSCPAWRN